MLRTRDQADTTALVGPRLLILILLLPMAAHAQIPLPGLGGDKDEPAVRLAEDPRQELERIRRELLERQQGLLLRSQDANDWAKRQVAVRERKAELVRLRSKIIREAAPKAAERAWETEETYIPEEPEPLLDAGGAEAGVTDGGISEGGVSDGGVSDGARDAGVAADSAADSGVSDGGAGDGSADGTTDGATDGLVDAGPPPPPPEPKTRMVTIQLPVVTYNNESFLAPGIHPAEAQELDRLLRAVAEVDEALSQMMRSHTAERTQVSAAVARAEKLMKEMDEVRKRKNALDDGTATKTGDPGIIGLKETESRALAAHLAEIAVSLASAQHRQAEAEGKEVRAANVTDTRPVTELEEGDVEPIAAFVDSHGRAVLMHAEAEKIDRERDGYATMIGMLKDRAERSRVLLHSLELKLANFEFNVAETSFNDALDKMRVTREELAWAQATFDRSTELRAKNIPRLEAKLDKLRRGGVTAGDEPGRLTPDEVRDVQQTLVAEKLVFERMKLARDEFRRDLAIALQRILSGEQPAEKFGEQHAAILDREELRHRLEDKKIRCDGWRRAQNTVDGAKATTGGSQTNKALILKAYEGLGDLCMREEWVLDTQQRLADIAQYHLKKLEWRSRGVLWYGWRILVSLLFLVVVVVAARWVGKVTRLLASRYKLDPEDKPATGPQDKKSGWRARLQQLTGVGALTLYLGGLSVVWLGAIIVCVNWIWGVPLALSGLLGWATYPIVFVGDHPVSVWSLARVFIWTMVAVWLGRPVQNFISGQLLEHFAIERGLRDAAGVFARYFVIFAGIAGGLASVGIGLGSLAVIIGVLSFGIGFGLQNIVANFISGFILLLERPIRKGDFIQVGDMVGEVMQISARATIVETRDAVSVIVPNSDLISEKVINLTKGGSERIRVHVEVGVAYGSDIKQVEMIMLGLARGHKDVLRWPAPAFRLVEFGDSSLNVVLSVWTMRLRTVPVLISDLNRRVDEGFREHGVEIPFPQRDLHIIPPKGDAPDVPDPNPVPEQDFTLAEEVVAASETPSTEATAKKKQPKKGKSRKP